MKNSITAKNKNVKSMPYEKFVHFGPGALTEGELLAIILRLDAARVYKKCFGNR